MDDVGSTLWWAILLTGMGMALWIGIIVLVLIAIATKLGDWR